MEKAFQSRREAMISLVFLAANLDACSGDERCGKLLGEELFRKVRHSEPSIPHVGTRTRQYWS